MITPQDPGLHYTKEFLTNNYNVMEENNGRLRIDRPVYQQSTLEVYQKHEESKGYPSIKRVKNVIKNYKCNPKDLLRTLIPSIVWLGDYKWKEYLIKDIIAGCTVAVMNIPQGMAYALLGNVPPVVGIYMAFFPVIVYAILGTSKHISMGSFAVICLMTGKVVATHSTSYGLSEAQHNATLQANSAVYSPIQVGTAVTFMVAIYQLIMYIFRLGILCSLLSETLINGFTAGAAVSVFTSQLKDLLGMEYPSYNGYMQVILTFISLFDNLNTINVAAVVVSCITITVLMINNEILKPWLSKKTIVPIPIEFIAVLTGTLLSRYCGIAEMYKLRTVGTIPVGIPEPQMPELNLLSKVALDSLGIAVIAYIISISMALIFANKLSYEIDSNQELLAQGCGNLVGSFFSCMPFAASLSRSVIQQTVGGCTQLTSLISSFLLLMVLLWVAPFFEPLPRCILSSLIIVALKGVLLQALDVCKIWNTSRLDGIVWIFTYVGVVVVDIEIGLLIGLATSMLVLIIRGMKSYICILERIPNTDLYVDTHRYAKTESIPGITIIRYEGSINFINKISFKDDILQLTKNMALENSAVSKIQSESNNKEDKYVIVLDLSALQYVDPAGATCLHAVIKQFQKSSISVLLAGVPGNIIDTLETTDAFKNMGLHYFPTIHDAVMFAHTNLEEPVFTIRL